MTKLTKAEIVELINMYPGPEVTTRARKDTLLEILNEREENAEKPMKKKCNMKKPLAIAAAIAVIVGIGCAVTPAKANIFSDAIDAVQGHVADVTDRFTHNDTFISGIELSSGMFRDDDIGRDPAHWTDGTATLIESGGDIFIQFDEDFKNGLAPDLYVYVASKKVVDEGSFWDAKPTEVAKAQVWLRRSILQNA